MGWILPHGPTAAAGDPREAPAPTARQMASEEPSGGGHGEETPKTSSHLLFLTCLLGCHNNGQLSWGWRGTGRLGTAWHSLAWLGMARHAGATGNPLGTRSPSAAWHGCVPPRASPSCTLQPCNGRSAPKTSPSACPHALSCKTLPSIPNTAGKTPTRRRPHSRHGHRLLFALSNLGGSASKTRGSVHGPRIEPFPSFPTRILQEKSRWDALGPSEPGPAEPEDAS